MRQGGSRGCSAAAASAAASATGERDRGIIFFRAFFSLQRAIEGGEGDTVYRDGGSREREKERGREREERAREREKGGPTGWGWRHWLAG